MNKYKLIKEFPGSPKLGIIWDDGSPDCAKYPEFWEEIIEKDYEILSFKADCSGITLLELHDDQKYAYKKGSNYQNKGFLTENQCLKDSYYSIYSVKRLSDGEIFTIGDNLDRECIKYNLDRNQNKISLIKIVTNPPSQVIANITDKFQTKDLLMFSTLGHNTNLNVLLKDAKKLKTPLFITEDSVDIFEGDCFIGIDKYWNVYNCNTSSQVVKNNAENWIYYSTKEKAEEYIIMNKPCLNIRELQNFKIFNSNQMNTLIQNVKNKLNK